MSTLNTLNLSAPNASEAAPLSAYQPQQPEKPKKASLALVLSLIMPGTGQIYAGRETAGAVTLAFFWLGVLLCGALLSQPGSAIGGTGLLMAASLYIFAFLDAYFSTLEYNAGIASFMIGGNPRIAGILNFLTNGFGYFYLGERAKGVWMFVGLGVVGHGILGHYFGNSTAFLLGWVGLQSLLAFDAYRLARRQLIASFPEFEGHSWKAAGQLPPVLPVALAIVLVLPLVGLLLLGSFVKGGSGIRGGTTVVVPQGVEYVNAAYGLKMTMPPGWTADLKQGEIHGQSAEGNCRVLLLRETSLLSPERYQRNVDAQVSRKEAFSVYDHRHAALDGRRAAAMTIGVGPSVTEQMITARTGLTLYSLIEVGRDDAEGCPAELKGIEGSLQFAR